MFFAFLFGAAAGVATPYAEPHLRKAMENVALKKLDLAEREMDLLTLVLLLLVAAALSGAGNSLALMLGALVGLLGKRIIKLIQGDDG
jgi:Na+/H+-dicarboxylate symporter